LNVSQTRMGVEKSFGSQENPAVEKKQKYISLREEKYQAAAKEG